MPYGDRVEAFAQQMAQRLVGSFAVKGRRLHVLHDGVWVKDAGNFHFMQEYRALLRDFEQRREEREQIRTFGNLHTIDAVRRRVQKLLPSIE